MVLSTLGAYICRYDKLDCFFLKKKKNNFLNNALRMMDSSLGVAMSSQSVSKLGRKWDRPTQG